MIHNRINDRGDHFGVSYTAAYLPGTEAKVLVQLQEGFEQVRVGMSPEDAEFMAKELLRFAEKVRSLKPLDLNDIGEE